jgi:hypothetical protein
MRAAHRVRFTVNEVIPEEGCRLTWHTDIYPSGRVRVALFGRLNMTSNARAGVWCR